MTEASIEAVLDGSARWAVVCADSKDVLPTLPDASVDSVVTDPPYGLSFMGKAWDYDVPGAALWREVLRVLKPGGHLLSFFGSRTYHRGVVQIEDAGFEVRDSLVWMYGTGFPKSLNVSKAIDEAAGAVREVVGMRPEFAARANRKRVGINPFDITMADGGFSNPQTVGQITAPATTEAAQWEGWGTALKPAHEPIVLARKPLIGTVAANVLAHGTGALNVDGCRIAAVSDDKLVRPFIQRGDNRVLGKGLGAGVQAEPSGRWPANVCLDEEAAALLDAQSGDRPGSHDQAPTRSPNSLWVGEGANTGVGRNDSGGASRFFYTAKASRAERGEPNIHPTVKPVDLMRWLVRLVTPPGGVVLDPFTGSASTGVACRLEAMRFLGIERDAHYSSIAKSRLSGWVEPVDAPLAQVRRADSQLTLFGVAA